MSSSESQITRTATHQTPNPPRSGAARRSARIRTMPKPRLPRRKLAARKLPKLKILKLMAKCQTCRPSRKQRKHVLRRKRSLRRSRVLAKPRPNPSATKPTRITRRMRSPNLSPRRSPRPSRKLQPSKLQLSLLRTRMRRRSPLLRRSPRPRPLRRHRSSKLQVSRMKTRRKLLLRLHPKRRRTAKRRRLLASNRARLVRLHTVSVQMSANNDPLIGERRPSQCIITHHTCLLIS